MSNDLQRSAAVRAASLRAGKMPAQHLLCVIAFLAVASMAEAAQYRGVITFNGLPVPGATVTATQSGKTLTTVTDQQGRYVIPRLADGACTIRIEMTGFSPIKANVTIAPNTPPAKWELKMLPLADMRGEIQRESHGTENQPPTTSTPTAATPSANSGSRGENENAPAESASHELSQLATPGLLINGSINNAASSPFALAPAFGNHRNGARGLYNGGIAIIFDNSALDAAPFSLSGQRTPKPVYNRITGAATFGGPLRIPHLLYNGPMVFAAYEWTRDVSDTTLSALVPNAAERGGDFSGVLGPAGAPLEIFDPATGLSFPGGILPQTAISPQARALLRFYPLPNLTGNGRYNFQAPILTSTHQDTLLSRAEQRLGNKDQVYGGFALLSSRTATPNLFGFLDTTEMLGLNTNANWSHRLNPNVFLKLGYEYSRLATRVTPYFENRENVSGDAGITGNSQAPVDWGPPSLTFASGIAVLADSNASRDRNQTSGLSVSLLWNHGLHYFTFGGDFRRQEFNYLSQQDPRGSFTFTGAATAGAAPGSGSDFADFLLGIPGTSSIAFGNADKYFRESVYDAYIDDDYRVRPGFTLDAGLRWEYGAPITELYNRLVNLDIAPGYTRAAPVVANEPSGPIGPVTGQNYPRSLVRPDWTGLEPRVGIAWRPIAGSSTVIRAGYGIYDNTSVYKTIALQMAQQSPLSKSLSVENSAACPLTLANGFGICPAVSAALFAIDPNFRVGYAQDWNAEFQRDLPGSLQLTVTYLGIKGTRGVQEFLPNTYPVGTPNPCPACPVGFTYFASNGNSTHEAGRIRLRRRLESGFTATLDYTYSKSIDDDSLLGGEGGSASQSASVPSWLLHGPGATGGTSQAPATVAQNWRDLAAERSLSAFDQRHLMTAAIQYTTGMGMGGGALLSGWRGTLFKEWTFLTQISVGSGLPETPVYLAPTQGTGVIGSIRPYYTGASIYAAPLGLALNPAAYTAPLSGEWGNAGRYSMIGPSQFSLDASFGRTFRVHGKYNLDLRIDSTNALNHPSFTTWIATINNAQFGLPAAVNPMRSLQTTLRLRF